MAIDLRDRVIIITGASSDGIGAATAIECARAGMHVVLNARRADRLEQVAAQVREFGVQAATVPGDVSELGVNQAIIDAAISEFGGFYSVFANAGYGMERAMANCSMAELRRIFDVNFFAGVDLLQRASAWLREQQRAGHLLMCSSCLGRFAMPNYAAYSSTKAAQLHVCAAMRAELKRDNIYVSSVLPISTQSEFHQTSMRINGVHVDRDALPDHAVKLFVQSPQRVARAVVRCLRRPRPEVWTSFIVRFAASLFTLSPRLNALVLDRQAKHVPRRRNV